MSTVISILSLPFLALGARIGPTAPHASIDSTAARDSSTMTLVEVQNDRRDPVTVYAQNGVGDITLGVVRPDDIGTLRVPEWLVAIDRDIHFFVQPKEGFEQESGPMELRRGERVGLIVPDR